MKKFLERETLTVGSLFAGIGGFDLGLERAGFQIKWQVEKDEWCKKILEKHWPGVRRYKDIHEVGAHNLETVDLICGGFPCQPFSHAGKRRGTQDDRYLWPETLRVVDELRPAWFIGENVAGLTSMGEQVGDIEVEGHTVARMSESDLYKTVLVRNEELLLFRIIEDLKKIGYGAIPFDIPACAVGADQERHRIWILAHAEVLSERPGLREGEQARSRRRRPRNDSGEDVSNPESLGVQRHRTARKQKPRAQTKEKIPGRDGSGDGANHWAIEPDVGRMAHGVPSRVDRIRALGNTVVPQVVEVIGKAIMEVEKTIK